VNSRRAFGEVSSPIAIPSLRFSYVILRLSSQPMDASRCVCLCRCVCLSVYCVCVSICLCLPVHQAWVGGGARGACSVDICVCGVEVSFCGEPPWPCPFPTFAEQLALGVNPSPAASVGSGCRHARRGRFAHLWFSCLVSLYLWGGGGGGAGEKNF